MDKYLVNVIVPLIEEEYDVYIPGNKKIGTIKKQVLHALTELTVGSFQKEENEVRMLDQETGKELDNNAYVKDSGIKNGSKIIIM